MGKNLEPKCKQCRRVGEKLMLKGDRCNSPKCAMVKRAYPPGLHGSKGYGKQSDYGLQLKEKQKARKQYNLLEKQFKLTFEKAGKMEGSLGENFLKLLEMRLDNAVYRAGLADSRSQARQIVNHGHIKVNGRKVNIPSYSLREGDKIEIKKSDNKYFKTQTEKAKNNKEVPGWMNFDTKEMCIKILHTPSSKDIEANINARMIVEYYSR